MPLVSRNEVPDAITYLRNMAADAERRPLLVIQAIASGVEQQPQGEASMRARREENEASAAGFRDAADLVERIREPGPAREELARQLATLDAHLALEPDERARELLGLRREGLVAGRGALYFSVPGDTGN